MPALTIPIAAQAQAVKAACARYAVPLQVFIGMYNEETSLGADVTTSSTGAIGPFQFEPATAGQYGYPLTNTPSESEYQAQAMGAAHMLSDGYQQFHSWRDALAAYNAGPGNIGAGMGYANAALAFAIPGNWMAALGSAPGAPVISNSSGARGPLTPIFWDDDFGHDYWADRYESSGFGPVISTVALHDLVVGEWAPLLWGAGYDGNAQARDPHGQVPAGCVPARASISIQVNQCPLPAPSAWGGLTLAFAEAGVTDWFDPKLRLMGALTMDLAGNSIVVATDGIGVDLSHAEVLDPLVPPSTPFTATLTFTAPDQLEFSLASHDEGIQSVTYTIPPSHHIDWATLAPWFIVNIANGPMPWVIYDWQYEIDLVCTRPGSIVPGAMAGGSVRGIQRVAGGAQQLPAQLVQQAVSLGIIPSGQAGKIQPGGQQGGSQRPLISASGGS